MSMATEPLQPRQIRYRYKLTTWQIRDARKTGFIGAVEAPRFVRHGHRYITDRHQMDIYLARRKEWEKRFLDGAQMTEYIRSPYAGILASKNADVIRISKLLPYRSVTPPEFYRFIGLKGKKFWHIEDLNVFIRFMSAVQNGNLLPANQPELYDDANSVWRPNYPSPPDFPERYTEETRLRVMGKNGS